MKDMATINTITSVKIRDAFLNRVEPAPTFLSIRELYNCPPSSGPIGNALNMPTLKLMNHSQKRKLAIIGKEDPSVDEYLEAIRSEYGTEPSAIVGGRRTAIGFEPKALLYRLRTNSGSGDTLVIVTPRIPLLGCTLAGIEAILVTS